MRLNNLPDLRTFRKELRSNLTPAEAQLWKMLKNSQIQGRKFPRQHSYSGYILDFYCSSEKLGIELDGEVHFNELAAQRDYERKLFLEYFGIKVIRFENKLVFDEPQFVLDRIKGCFGWRSGMPSAEWVDWLFRPSGRLTTPSAETAATPPLEGGELFCVRNISVV